MLSLQSPMHVLCLQCILVWTGYMSCVQQPKSVGSCPVGQCWFSRLNVLGTTILLSVFMHYSEIIVSFFASFLFFCINIIQCHLVCLKDLMDLFQCIMKPIVLITEPRNSGLLLLLKL